MTVLGAGDLVGGRYEVDVLLARGGMADVYRAREVGSGRPVALKVMRAGEHDDRRFAREARLLAGLDHPNLVRLLDVGHHDERPYPATAHQQPPPDTIAGDRCEVIERRLQTVSPTAGSSAVGRHPVAWRLSRVLRRRGRGWVGQSSWNSGRTWRPGRDARAEPGRDRSPR